MMDVHYIYYDNHIMTYVSQTIMLYTLNFYNTVCKLYLIKMQEKNKMDVFYCILNIP